MVENLAGDAMDEYERLLGEAMAGEATLFVREDAVLRQWEIVEFDPGQCHPCPSLQAWKLGAEGSGQTG